MKKFKPNLPLGVGWILYALTHIATHIIANPNNLIHFLTGVACALIVFGVALSAFSSSLGYKKFRSWKFCLKHKDI